LVAAIAAAPTACAPTVVDGTQPNETGQPNEGQTGANQGQPSANQEQPSSGGLAILYKDMPSGPQDFPISVPVPEGNVDPDTLVLLWSNQAETCASPRIGCSDGFAWQSILTIPPDLVQVGMVDMTDPRVQQFSFEFFDTMCSGGGGGGPYSGGASLEIVSMDASSITVTLSGGYAGTLPSTVNGTPYPSVILDGNHTLARCP
jgi:hypothetical protein